LIAAFSAGNPKRIPAHGMQHVQSAHAFVACPPHRQSCNCACDPCAGSRKDRATSRGRNTWCVRDLPTARNALCSAHTFCHFNSTVRGSYSNKFTSPGIFFLAVRFFVPALCSAHIFCVHASCFSSCGAASFRPRPPVTGMLTPSSFHNAATFLRVVAQLVDGRLQNKRAPREHWVIHDPAECFQPNLAFADVFVTVHAGNPDAFFESFTCTTRTRSMPTVRSIACNVFSKPSVVRISHPAANVWAVSMHTPSGRSGDASRTARSSSKPRSQRRALPCGIFEQDFAGPSSFRPRARLLQTLRDRGDCRVCSAFLAAPWVRHQKIRAQRKRPHDFLMKRLHRTRAQHRIRWTPD
jgi:hypothetical protein